MCLIIFAYNSHPKYKLILAANRDEFYARKTSSAAWWTDHPNVLGGRDLQAMGTWMGISKEGRFAAVTNYRDIQNIKSGSKTRGDLTKYFLIGNNTPEEYSKIVFGEGHRYNGFNLLVMDENELAYVSNYYHETVSLGFGIYGLSNALLDTPWPKVTKAKADFESLIQKDFRLDDLISIMQDTSLADDDRLPATGLDYSREKALSAICIQTPDYGTCCSTAITIDYEGNVDFKEKSYLVGDRDEKTVHFQFKLSSLHP